MLVCVCVHVPVLATKTSRHLSHRFFCVSDSSGMWEEQEEDEGDDDEEDEGLAGQLLSDLIASNKYGKSAFTVHQLLLYECTPVSLF